MCLIAFHTTRRASRTTDWLTRCRTCRQERLPSWKVGAISLVCLFFVFSKLECVCVFCPCTRVAFFHCLILFFVHFDACVRCDFTTSAIADVDAAFVRRDAADTSQVKSRSATLTFFSTSRELLTSRRQS